MGTLRSFEEGNHRLKIGAAFQTWTAVSFSKALGTATAEQQRVKAEAHDGSDDVRILAAPAAA